MVPWKRRRETSSSSQIILAPILNLPHEMWLRIQHFLQSSDYLSASTTCRALRSFLYPIIFRQMSISLAPLPSSASLDALVNSPVPQYVHTLRIARDPRSRDTAWLVQKATVPSFQRLFRRLINVRNIVLMDINMSHPSYLFEWMLKNKCLECVTFKGLNEGKFPKDFWSQLSPSLQVSVHCGPLGDKQAHFLDAAPITRLRTTWSHLFALMESSNGPSFDRLTVLSITMHKSLLEVLWVLRYLPTLQKLLLRGPITYQHVNHSQDQLDELTEMAKTALPHLQEVTTTSSDFLTTLLLDKRPLRRVECQGISNDIYNFIFNLLRTAHLTVETLGFQCTPEEFELLEKVRLFKSLRCLYVTLMPHSWSPLLIIPETCPPLPETLTELRIVCTHSDYSINHEYKVDLYELRGQLFKLLQHLQSATLLLHRVLVIFSPNFRKPLLYLCTRVAEREWAIRELNQQPSKAECRAISLLNGFAIGPRTVEPGSDFDWYHKREDWE